MDTEEAPQVITMMGMTAITEITEIT